MDAREAILAVLGSSGEEMHWTVVWDRALRSGYVNPLEDPGARDTFLRTLGDLAREGLVVKTSKGTYRRA